MVSYQQVLVAVVRQEIVFEALEACLGGGIKRLNGFFPPINAHYLRFSLSQITKWKNSLSHSCPLHQYLIVTFPKKTLGERRCRASLAVGRTMMRECKVVKVNICQHVTSFVGANSP
jgi:hypothetical protein